MSLLSFVHTVLSSLSKLATSHVDLSLVMFKYENLAYVHVPFPTVSHFRRMKLRDQEERGRSGQMTGKWR